VRHEKLATGSIGDRTLAMAQRLVHQVTQVLAPDCAPLFLTDGFREYVTALVGHYGQWIQPERRQAKGPQPKPRWMPLPQLLYAQVVKSYRRRRIVGVKHRMVFGAAQNKGIRLDGFHPVVVELGNGFSAEDLWIHDEQDFYKAQILVRMFDDPTLEHHLPRPFGVFYQNDRPTYEEMLNMQVEEVIATKGKGDLDKLLRGNETWTIV